MSSPNPPQVIKKKRVVQTYNCAACDVEVGRLRRSRRCRKCDLFFCSDCCLVRTCYPVSYGYSKPKWTCKSCMPEIYRQRTLQESCEELVCSNRKHSHVPWKEKPPCIDNGSFETHNNARVHIGFKIMSPVGRLFFRASGMREGKDFHRTLLKKAMKLGPKPLPAVKSQTRHTIPVPKEIPEEKWTRDQLYDTPPFMDHSQNIVESLDTWSEISSFVFLPKEMKDNETLPVLVWYHGGGFCIGSMEDYLYEYICRTLCNRIHCIVVSVEYRLAPEFQFPVQLEDAYWALLWTYEQLPKLYSADVSRIAVAGDSAGGSLSACVSILSKLRNGPKILHQVLIYPCLTNPNNDDLESHVIYKNGPLLTRKVMAWMMQQCLGDSKVEPSSYFPLQLDEEILRGLPPALIINAAHDPLRDHGEAYFQKLKSVDVPVRRTVYSKSIHGFFGSQIGESEEAMMEAVTALGETFYGSPNEINTLEKTDEGIK